MILAPMRFKDYVWPHNPRTYSIEYERKVAVHKVPAGAYFLQSLGRTNRVLKGKGEFAGEGAYDEFKKLATVFYDDTPGLLVHPVWQNATAYFVSLSLTQEPMEDYVAYSFEFWECYDQYTAILRESGSASSSASGGSSVSAETAYTVVSGDTLSAIANKYGMTLAGLLELNPKIKNPNLIHPGDVITVVRGA